MNFKLFVILLMLACPGLTSKYIFLPNCPHVLKPVIITEDAINKNMFVVVQIHIPATATKNAYLHRKRYSMRNVVKSIGTDPEVDFRRRKTLVFMDGYVQSTHYPTSRTMVGNYAALGYNTLSFDAQPLYSFFYPTAVRMTYPIGNITAHVLKGLMQYGLRPRDVELLGVSLGGQSVSSVAKSFYRITGQKIGRILSMDPSGPCFSNLTTEYRLTPSDADFVQVIHTGIDGFGIGQPSGHVDFYINGGEWQFIGYLWQPWCEELCTHVMCVPYTFTSLRLYPDKFVGVKCKNVQQAREHKCYENTPYETNLLGFKADPKKPGIYYMSIRGTAPFYPSEDWMETKPIIPREIHDALSDVEVLKLSKKSYDENLGSPVYHSNGSIENSVFSSMNNFFKS